MGKRIGWEIISLLKYSYLNKYDYSKLVSVLNLLPTELFPAAHWDEVHSSLKKTSTKTSTTNLFKPHSALDLLSTLWREKRRPGRDLNSSPWLDRPG
jgi:hypothetical protein